MQTSIKRNNNKIVNNLQTDIKKNIIFSMTKLLKKYDVVIIGGGTSGCAAAYNCAKLKLKTLLVEKNNYLGGLMTGGLVIPVMKSSVSELNTDYYKKLIKIAKKYNAQITYSDKNDGWLNPEILKIALVDLLTSTATKKYLNILFETSVDEVIKNGRNIKKVMLNSKLLSIPVVSKYYIDCTGSGEFSKKAGCKFLNDTSVKQENSLRFIVGNVDIKKFTKFILETDKDRDITNTNRDDVNNDVSSDFELHFTTASTKNTDKVWALDKYLKLGVKDGSLNETDRAYFQLFSVAGAKGEVAFNCPRIKNFNNDIYKSSLSLISGYKAIWRLYNFVKKYFPGFENSYIVNIATVTGSREERRIVSQYIYKKVDLIKSKKFKNPVLISNYGIDVHSNKNMSTHKKDVTYELPVESLISKDVQNLFVSGKLVGAEFEAHSALRVQKSCMSMAEGIAKYISKLI